ncbi:MAG TPA: hypothetical protein VNH64_04720, partial [Parvularculaceae bacterium]|nr:hypothetical protein [Parvularculaceae bacterium]
GEAQIEREKIGEHSPDDVDRTFLGKYKVKEPQHLLKKKQHSRNTKGEDQRCNHRAQYVTINKAHEIGGSPGIAAQNAAQEYGL